MNSVTTDQLLTQLKWRYATKQFDATKKINATDWAALEEALVLTPSSFGLQPWKFIVVIDPAVKARLLPASWGQSQVTDCSHHVVFALKKNLGETEIDAFLDRQIEVRGGSKEALKGYRDAMVGNLVNGPRQPVINEWAAHQVYIALGNFMTSAAVLGIDACPMEGIDAQKYDEILGLTGTGYATAVACSTGYRSATDKYATAPKVRFKKESVISYR